MTWKVPASQRKAPVPVTVIVPPVSSVKVCPARPVMRVAPVLTLMVPLLSKLPVKVLGTVLALTVIAPLLVNEEPAGTATLLL